MRVDRRRLIEFFDCEPDAAPHASAIKAIVGEELGLALFVQFLGSTARRVDAPCRIRGAWVSRPALCNPGQQKGQRLDGWVRVDGRDAVILYQVEVKVWAWSSVLRDPAMGCGACKPAEASPRRRLSRRLPPDVPPATLRAHKMSRWAEYWCTQCGFRHSALCKVLDEMKRPVGADKQPLAGEVRPLACLWDAVHPTGADAPLFEIRIPERVPNQGGFSHLWVFSMSAYLRSLADADVELDLPYTTERLQWLDRIFTTVQERTTRHG